MLIYYKLRRGADASPPQSYLGCRLTWRLAVAALSAAVMAGCGGGGNGGSDTAGGETTTPPAAGDPAAITARLSTDVTVLGAADLGAQGAVLNDDGGAVASGTGPALAALNVGDVVHLSSGSIPGMPIGFTGRVMAKQAATGTTTVEFAPANVEDVYQQLAWDLDTQKTGVQALAVVADAGRQALERPMDGGTQGLSISASGLINGTVALERAFTFEGAQFKLSATVSLEDVSVRTKGRFDAAKLATGGGWAEIGAVATGKLSGRATVQSSDGVSIALGSALYQAAAWKDLKWNTGQIFSVQGLEGTDKAGRIPLGGIIIVPATGVAATFTGSGGGLDNSATLSALAAASAVVVWVYTDASGQITFNGEAGIEAESIGFKFGRELTLEGSSFAVNSADDFRADGKVRLVGSGKLDATQRLGWSVSADVLLGGVRPLSINGFAGLKYTGSLRGSQMTVELLPTLGATSGNWACLDNTLWAGAETEAAFRIKAQLGFVDPSKAPEWAGVLSKWSSSTIVEYQAKGAPVDFFKQTLKRSQNAVCEGKLTPSSLELDVQKSKRLTVIDNSGEKLIDLSGGLMPLPSRLRWVVANPAIARVTPDVAGALISGLAAGATEIVVTDDSTKWSGRMMVVVGENCWMPPIQSTDPISFRRERYCYYPSGQVSIIYSSHISKSADGGVAEIGYSTAIYEDGEANPHGASPLLTMIWGNYGNNSLEKSYFPKTGETGRKYYGYWRPARGDIDAESYLEYWEDIGFPRSTTRRVYRSCGGFERAYGEYIDGQEVSFDTASVVCPTREEIDAINNIHVEDNYFYQQDQVTPP